MVFRAILVILIVGLTGIYAHRLSAERAYSEALPVLTEIPAAPEGWRSEDFPLTETVAAVLAADVTLQRRYVREDGSEVWLFVAYFAEQQVNSQIHSPRHCVPGSGWTIVSTGQETLELPSGPKQATHMEISRQGRSQDMYYWFRTRGGVVTGEYSLKWDLVVNSLARRPTDAAFIRYSASREDRGALDDLMAQLDGPLTRTLGAVGLR
jgi:EpsI family protein